MDFSESYFLGGKKLNKIVDSLIMWVQGEHKVLAQILFILGNPCRVEFWRPMKEEAIISVYAATQTDRRNEICYAEQKKLNEKKREREERRGETEDMYCKSDNSKQPKLLMLVLVSINP
ncbi:hypothetical protein KQX54_008013 [Cotesia glomerata]|uniref:Uncharacterized protein n=1 Tax=Cotesia glomerata TaxID=32391 RepID=A0AAV7I3I5_COTGL|nr:hypothetical protein KQX54_008013 [Cotesia glomerata]